MKTTGTTALMLALHARVEELEAMLESVGAGGVSAQRVRQGKDHTEQQVRELLAAHGITQKKRSNDKEEQQWQ